MSTDPRQDQSSYANDIAFDGRSLPKKDEDVHTFNARELDELKSRNYIPREIHIQISRRCNLQCVMCSWETWKSNTGLMDDETFERILKEAKETGIRKIIFGNAQGEPFLHPKACDMIERVVQQGFWTMVSTNGTPLTPKRIKQLAKSGIHNIQFSFAGYNKETYETIYAGAKWEKVTENLQSLVEALREFKSQSTLVINGCYAKELEKIVSPNAFIARSRAFLTSIGIGEPHQQIIIQLPHNFGGNIDTGSQEISGATTNFAINTQKPGLCRVLKNTVGIYHDGKITACGCLDPNGELEIGDLSTNSLSDVRQESPYQTILKDFVEGNLQNLPLCKGCDIPYYERPQASPRSWETITSDIAAPKDNDLTDELESTYQKALKQTLVSSIDKLINKPRDSTAYVNDLMSKIKSFTQSSNEPAYAISHRLFTTFAEDPIIEEVCQKKVKRIGLAPATKAVLDNLDWFQKHFEEVIVGDNYKTGQEHFGQTIVSVDDLISSADQLDTIMLTTNTPDIEAIYKDILPKEKTFSISELSNPMNIKHFSRFGLARAERLITEIEASENPLIVLGYKLLATAEPTFVALERAGYDVFVISQTDKMENPKRTGYDPGCAIYRNALVNPYEQIYILQNLKRGVFWMYYDFFFNTGWDAANSLTTYGNSAALMSLAKQPVVLGMYDIIKPICQNMDQAPASFGLYKVMLDMADGVALTSKSDHIAEYLRNTLVKDRPVTSFYRYSFSPRKPLPKLSKTDGERHLVGVTSFLGEVFEPNRIETKNSIRSILRQGIHFHYYSEHPKVIAFYESLPEDERAYFHLEKPIWEQQELVHNMSRFDGGWLVGDEATIFARLITQIEDRHIRELYTLFVPNGVPTSSMTYGSAGLAVFISRQIKVMDEVYPPGCCVPLDMGEIDNLTNIFARLDWDTMHHTMHEQSDSFNIFKQIPRLVRFLDDLRDSHAKDPKS